MELKIGGVGQFREVLEAEEGTSLARRESPAGNAVEPFREVGLNVRPVYSDKFVRIVSDERVSQTAAKSLAARVEAAYQRDIVVQRWEDTKSLARPLTVAVLSGPGFEALTGDESGSVGGVTISADTFVVPDRVLGRATAQDQDTIAHELGHVQDLREAGARIREVPIYLQEGKEYLLGDSYPKNNPHLRYVAQALAGVKAELAEDVMFHFRTVEDEMRSGPMGFYGETIGALYVEWLRTRANGHGFPDAIQRVANVIENVGNGRSYEAAFQKEFGESPSISEQKFIRFIKDTEGKPKERLAGTLYG